MARKKNTPANTANETAGAPADTAIESTNAPAQSENDEAAVVAQLDAQDQQAAPAPEEKTPAGPLSEAVASLIDKQKQDMAKKIAKAYDARAEFETKKNPGGASIHKNLDKSRAKLIMPSAAALLLVSNVNPDFINASVNDGSRYNVYAADKLADLVQGLRDGVIRNAINNAITRSLFAFKDAGEPFTSDMAKAAASKQYPVKEKKLKDLLIRHTVSPSVASTQTSSTMTALQTLGAVKNVGSVKHPVYELTSEPVVDRLRELIAA